MPLIITHRCDGFEPNGNALPKSNTIDMGNSIIYVSTVPFDFKSTKPAPNVIQNKYTNSVITGYTAAGYSFQLLFEGQTAGDACAFITEFILPSIDKASQSVTPSNARELMQTLESAILTQGLETGVLDSNIQIAFAISYHHNLKHYCTGFSHNHFGLLLKRNTGKIEPLRLTYQTEVCPQDEIVGATLLSDKVWGKPFSALMTNLTEIEADESLFYTLIMKMKTVQSQEGEKRKDSGMPDLSQNSRFKVSRMLVPSSALSKTIYAHYFINEIKKYITDFIKNQNSGLNGLFEFFAPHPNLLRAQHYIKLIEKNHDNTCLCLLIIQSMMHEPKERELRAYIDGTRSKPNTLSTLRTILLSLLNNQSVPIDEMASLRESIRISVDNHFKQDDSLLLTVQPSFSS